MIDLSKYLDKLDDHVPATVRGRIKEVTGLVIKASVPMIVVGEVVEIQREGKAGTPRRPLEALVVGFKDELAVLMPFGDLTGIGPGCTVVSTGQSQTIRCGPGLLGRVLDGLGRPIDGGPPLTGGDLEDWPVDRGAPDPMKRPRINARFHTGVRAIDAMLTLGEGQRVGIFAGSGVGKSTLLGQIARGAEADVVVIGLVGERGRELRDFIESSLGQEGLARAVVVCATSDQPSMIRLRAAHVTTAIAEHFRHSGKRVLLLMDSLTRYARALREVGLAAGEPPARRGYPPSVFEALPRLLERTGKDARGSITALYTVLVAGSDMEEPVADEVRSIVDGHIVLDRAIAARGHYPPIDVLRSISRVMDRLIDPQHAEHVGECRRVMAAYEEKRDLIALGAYRRGSDPDVDFALEIMPELEALLRQDQKTHTTFEETIEMMQDLFG